eukprot:scaffold20738_cov113-Isochrysis_galbana.AAC.4
MGGPPPCGIPPRCTIWGMPAVLTPKKVCGACWPCDMGTITGIAGGGDCEPPAQPPCIPGISCCGGGAALCCQPCGEPADRAKWMVCIEGGESDMGGDGK